MGTGGTPRVPIDPDEEFGVSFDYDPDEDLPAGSLLLSGTVAATRISDGQDSAAEVLDSAVATISNGGLRTTASVLGGGSGEAGEEHLIKISNTLDSGEILVDKFLLIVDPDPTC